MISITEQQLKLFMSLFRGRTEVYARRWEKDGRSGYSPAYEFTWDEFMAHKRHGGSMKDFENKKLIPLTKEIIKKHHLQDVLFEIAQGKSVMEVLNKEKIDLNEIEEFVIKLIKEKPGLNVGGYMGIIIREFKGKVSGKEAMEIVKKYVK